MNNNQAQPLMADLTTSTALDTWSGSKIWAKGYILRVIPGDDGDNLVPFEVFFDPISGRILDNTLPVEIRDEYNTQPTSETSTPPSKEDNNWGSWEQNENNQQEDITTSSADESNDWGTWATNESEQSEDNTEQNSSGPDINWGD